MPFTLIIILSLALVAVAISSAPTQESQKPASIDDFDLPTAEPGRVIPIVHGTVLLKAPNVVWYGDLGYEAVKTGGGK